MLAKWQHAFRPCEFIVNLSNAPPPSRGSFTNTSEASSSPRERLCSAMLRHKKFGANYLGLSEDRISPYIAQIHWFVIIFCLKWQVLHSLTHSVLFICGVLRKLMKLCGFQRLVPWSSHKQLLSDMHLFDWSQAFVVTGVVNPFNPFVVRKHQKSYSSICWCLLSSWH